MYNIIRFDLNQKIIWIKHGRLEKGLIEKHFFRTQDSVTLTTES